MTAKRHTLEWSDGAAGPLLDALESDWRARSACRTADPALFFSSDEDRETTYERQARETLALAVCDLCPVVADCEAFVLAHGIRQGVFAGATEREREPLHDAYDARLLASGRKRCRGCHTVMLLGDFPPHANSRDGHFYECATCLGEATRWVQNQSIAA